MLATMLALKMEQEAMSQGLKGTFLAAREGKGNGVSITASRRTAGQFDPF